jgi:hypothetical protein
MVVVGLAGLRIEWTVIRLGRKRRTGVDSDWCVTGVWTGGASHRLMGSAWSDKLHSW